MAGVVATTTVWDALLQEQYVLNGIVEAINVATPFRDELTRTGMTSGRRRIYPVKVGASQGTGARAESSTMPAYGAGEYVDATVTAKYNYAPFKVTGQSLEFGTKAAFVDFGMQILKDTKQGLQLSIGRQCWGDGQGFLGLINAGAGYAAGIATVVVDSPYGVAWGSLTSVTTMLLKRNQVVQFGTEDNGGVGYRITAVTATGITFTPVLANAIADNATISLLASSNMEVEGAMAFAITAALSTTIGISTTYHGINRTTYPEWEGNVVNAAAALSLSLIRQTRDAIYKRTDDEESNLMIGSTEMARDYEALLQATRISPTTKLEGGRTSLEHDGLRFSKDSRAPIRSLWFFDTKAIAWAQTRDPHWLQDGNGIMRVVPGQDALEGLLKWYSNLDVNEPRHMALLYNVTAS